MKKKSILKKAGVVFIFEILLISGLAVANKLPIKNEYKNLVINKSTVELGSSSSSDLYPMIKGKWDYLHTIYIYINKIWVYDCSDKREDEPGEFYFNIIAIPGFQFSQSPVFDVYDDRPQTSYNFGLIGSIPTRFTPQFIVIQAVEQDNKADFDFNDHLSRIIIKFNPPDGEYTPNHPYSEPVIRWIGRPYFEADISISFYHK